jgi:carboxyl-terminal processing protease
MMRRLDNRTVISFFWMILLLATLGACAGIFGNAQVLPNKEMEHMLHAVFADIRDKYIEDLSAKSLALTTLEGLQKFEPGARASSERNQIVVRIDGTPVARVAEPSGGDTDLWATAVAQVVAQASIASILLQRADPEAIYKATFDAILGKLDKFSRYAGREEARKNRANRTGFGGIGVTIESHIEGAQVMAVTPGMTADKVGIQVGDRIVAIDDNSVTGRDLRAIVNQLRGPVGKNVRVTIQRDGDTEPLELSLTRAHIVANTVFYEPRGAIAYVRVSSFNRETGTRLKQALRSARRKIGEHITGIILDVRDNPGGLLDQAVDAADLFLTHGRIISTRGRHLNSAQRFDATAEVSGGGLPIAILVNGTSASAAEILATALQDHDRAVVVGTTSFGKGSVQTVRRMPNDGELILTWARFYAPSGYALHRLGVLPTICTSGADDAASVLDKSLNTEAHFTRRDHASRRTADITDENDAKIILSLCPWRPRKGSDIDLEVAERLLAEPALYLRAIELAHPAAGT